MRTRTKVWLIIAASFVLAGGIIFVGVMTIFNWDFTKLSTVKYETGNYGINEEYENISIVTNTADVSFVPSENSKTSVICHQQKNMKHLVEVQDGTLSVEVVDTRKWYEHIGINFDTPKITVYIPQGEYGTLLVKSSTGDVKIPKEFKFKSIDILESTGNVTNYASALEDIKIKTSTGNIVAESISAGMLDLSVSTGEIRVSKSTCKGDVKIAVSTGKTNMTDIKCKSVVSMGNTGDIYLKNVIAAERFSVERSTGNVRLDGCDAAEIFIKTDTGDVRGSLLNEKVFIVESDTGRVDVPKTATGGKCEIYTDTGSVSIKVQ